MARHPGFSSRRWKLSPSFSLGGLSLKTCRTFCIPTKAETLQRSSFTFASAGMMRRGECSTLRVSECRKVAADCSWLDILEPGPATSLFLIPRQWSQYLARLRRHASHGPRASNYPILFWHQTRTAALVSAVKFSSVTEADGIRWLSGSESLKLQGFPSEWMITPLRAAFPPGTQSLHRLLGGLRK